jgi:hypothetical protein
MNYPLPPVSRNALLDMQTGCQDGIRLIKNSLNWIELNRPEPDGQTVVVQRQICSITGSHIAGDTCLHFSLMAGLWARPCGVVSLEDGNVECRC